MICCSVPPQKTPSQTTRDRPGRASEINASMRTMSGRTSSGGAARTSSGDLLTRLIRARRAAAPVLPRVEPSGRVRGTTTRYVALPSGMGVGGPSDIHHTPEPLI